MRAIIVRKKFWGLQMLTWVWLAWAKPELTKPKSTFRPQNFLSGLRASHEQSIPFTNYTKYPLLYRALELLGIIFIIFRNNLGIMK